jgi:hypothetical protein
VSGRKRSPDVGSRSSRTGVGALRLKLTIMPIAPLLAARRSALLGAQDLHGDILGVGHLAQSRCLTSISSGTSRARAQARLVLQGRS